MRNCASEVWSGAYHRAAPARTRWDHPGMTNKRLQLHLPGLANQALAETAVGFARDLHESGVLIDLARGEQDALGPQRDFAIAAGPRKRDAFPDQPPPQTQSAPGRIDQQQPQFGNLVAVPDQ